MKVKIEFQRNIWYSAEIEVTDAEYDIIKDLDNDDLPMYIRKDGKIISNPAYDIISPFTEDEYVYDMDEEINNASVELL
ncbi:hypothetical protein CMT52_07740 [Elizabethkingia anophelis]|nr:hypothetical protein [Elizabethkingia anophelis]